MAPRKKQDEIISLGVEIDKASEQDFKRQIDTLNAYTIAKQRDAIAAARKSNQDYATNMKRSFEVPIPAVEKNTKAVKALGDELERTGKKAKDVKGFQLGGVERSTGQIAGAIGGIFGNQAAAPLRIGADILQFTESVSELPQVLGVAGQGVTGLVGALGPFVAVTIAAAPAVIAVTKGLELFDAQTKTVTNNLGSRTRTVKDLVEILGGTTEEALKAIEENAKTISILEKEAAIRKGNLDKTFTDLVKQFGDLEARVRFSRDPNTQKAEEELKALNQQITDLRLLSNDAFFMLKNGATATADAIAQQEAETRRLEEAARNAAATEKRYHDVIVENQELRRQEFAKQLEQERDKEAKMVDILKNRDAAIEDIEQKSADSRIALEKRTADTIEKIVQDAIDANEKAFEKLQEAQAKLLADAGNAELEADRRAEFDDLQSQIDANRAERDELESHLQKVRDIQRSFRAQERDAVYDRNFDQLFRLQESKADQLSAEDEHYADQKAARERAIKEEQQDTARQRQFERNERRIALQISLNQARDGYLKELELNRQAKEASIRTAQAAAVEELNLINQTETIGIELKRQGAIRELELINQTEAEKFRIFMRYLNEAKSLLGQPTVNPNSPVLTGVFTNSSDAGGVDFFAGGGVAQAGRPFEYNDSYMGQRETFGGMMLPAGRGIAYPFQSGTVSPGSATTNHNEFNFTIRAIDPKGTRNEIKDVLREFFR